MNTTSASRVESAMPAGPAQASPVAPPRVLIWDAPLRLFHWLAVASFFGAWITAESERFRLLHVTLGYTLAGLVAFRLLWGLWGSRHARFASFVRGPRAVARYLRSLVSAQPEHHAGHNPAGAWAIVGLLALAATVAVSGWALDNDIAGRFSEELHEGLAHAMLVLVAVHIAGVLVSSLVHGDNLVRGMITGRKAAAPAEAIGRPRRVVAVLVAASVLGFWGWQWSAAPAGAAAAGARVTAIEHKAARDQGDDD